MGRKRNIYLVAIVCLLTFAACRGEGDKQESGVKNSYRYSNYTYLAGINEGYYYIADTSTNDRLLRGYDFENMRDFVLCEQLNCRHDSSACQAWLGNWIQEGIYFAKEIAIRDGKIYGIGTDDYQMNEHMESPNYLYRMDQNGKNREKIAYLNDGQLHNYQLCLTEKYAYYSAIEYDWEDTSVNAKLCRIDLEGKEEPEVMQTCENGIFDCYVYGDTIVVCDYKQTEKETSSGVYVIRDGEDPVCVLEDVIKCSSTYWMEGNWLYGAWDGELHKYNVETKEDVILMPEINSEELIREEYPSIQCPEMYEGNNGLSIMKMGKYFYVHSCMQVDLIEFATPGNRLGIQPTLWKLDEKGNVLETMKLDSDCLSILYLNEKGYVSCSVQNPDILVQKEW